MPVLRQVSWVYGQPRQRFEQPAMPLQRLEQNISGRKRRFSRGVYRACRIGECDFNKSCIGRDRGQVTVEDDLVSIFAVLRIVQTLHEKGSVAIASTSSRLRRNGRWAVGSGLLISAGSEIGAKNLAVLSWSSLQETDFATHILHQASTIDGQTTRTGERDESPRG